jgi:hypothetical protein
MVIVLFAGCFRCPGSCYGSSVMVCVTAEVLLCNGVPLSALWLVLAHEYVEVVAS